VLFFAGLAYWAVRGYRGMLTLYLVVLVTLPLLALLVVPINTRYVYGVYPFFIAAAIISGDTMVRRIARGSAAASAALAPVARQRMAALLAWMLIVAWVGNAELDKLQRSYGTNRERDYRSAWAHIAAHKQPGDKLMSVLPQGAAVVFGGADYYAMAGTGFDGLYQRPHGIVDRWSGARLAWKIDQYREIFLRHERVWVVVDELRLASLGQEIGDFLNDCCSVEAEFFGGRVLLWERSAGRFATAPDHGGGADSF
jgi:hypothetical protein